MPYRRIELAADKLDFDGLNRMLDEVQAFDRFKVVVEQNSPARLVFVVDETRTEGIINELQSQYGHTSGFKLMIHELTALWPRPEPPQPPPQEVESSENGGLRIGARRMSRDELFDDLSPGSRISAVYLGQVLISCVVASFGLIRDNVTMVIAAMVIAPLLLPNMALALGTTLGDLQLVRRATITSAGGVAAGFALSLAVGWLVPFDPLVREIALRTHVSFADLAIALCAGAAGAMAVTTGVSANLIGVMVAVALVPPLVVMGLLLGAGEFAGAGGATILLLVNIVCVNLAAVAVFLFQGVRPNTWYEAAVARRATVTAIVLWCVLLACLMLLIWLAAPPNPLTD